MNAKRDEMKAKIYSQFNTLKIIPVNIFSQTAKSFIPCEFYKAVHHKEFCTTYPYSQSQVSSNSVHDTNKQ